MTLEERVWSKVNRRGEDECWPWLGNLDKDGYGQITVRFSNKRRRNFRATRLIFEFLHSRSVYPRLQICHTCDNPICCNPAHFVEADNHWNALDRDSKGRTSKGEKHSLATKEKTQRGEAWHKSHVDMPRGEKHGMAKLTKKQVDEIRMLAATTKLTYKKLATMFSVSVTTVGRIVRLEKWN